MRIITQLAPAFGFKNGWNDKGRRASWLRPFIFLIISNSLR